MSIYSINSIGNHISDIIYFNPIKALPIEKVNKYIDIYDLEPEEDDTPTYDELVVLSDPRQSTEYLLSSSIEDFQNDIASGNISKAIFNLPFKKIIMYSNPITSSYEINKMAHEGKLDKDDADKLQKNIMKKTVGYGLNIIG